MIIGNGFIASAFSEYATPPQPTAGVTIFASGVSNSQCIDPQAFKREEKLLKTAIILAPKNNLFVYFSTCSIYERTHSLYVAHKLHMETILQNKSAEGDGIKPLIIRLPQIVGRSPNPHTLLNFLYNKVQSGEPFEIWKYATRYVIDIKAVVKTVNEIIHQPTIAAARTIGLTTYPTTPLSIVKTFERVLDKEANYTIVPKGNFYTIPGYHVDTYLESALRKYYTCGGLKPRREVL